MPNRFIDKVRSTVLLHGMAAPGSRVLAAVSGGVDSVVLLDALFSLSEELRLSIGVCHLNHNLRGAESERDLRFVKALAGRLGLEFYGKRLGKGALSEKGPSLQEAARAARYAFFEEAAASFGADRVALGHNLDDQAETVLMRVMKGSSLSGLSGIPPVRGVFVRPLIETPRAEIERYALERGLEHVTDSSNLKDGYLRNRVRLKLVPLLKRDYNPNISATLARTASLLSADAEFIERYADGLWAEVLESVSPGAAVLDRGKLLGLHRAISSRLILRAALLAQPESAVESVHLDAVFGILTGGRPNASVDLPGLTVTREYGRVVLSKARREDEGGYSYTPRIPGETSVPEAGCVIKARVLPAKRAVFRDSDAAYFDLDSLKSAGEPLIRPFRAGDRMAPLGMKGTKKVKDIFIDAKVPKARRAVLPLLCAQNEVLWVAGIRQSGSHMVSKATKKVLRLELKEVK